jgi:hypothetical protein
MPRIKTYKGERVDNPTPDWAPLLWVVNDPEVVACFMWMGAVALDDGRVLHLYKHQLTRGYLHLDREGHTFEYTESDRYRPCSTFGMLAAVLRGQYGQEGWDELLIDASDWALQSVIDREYRVETLQDRAEEQTGHMT